MLPPTMKQAVQQQDPLQEQTQDQLSKKKNSKKKQGAQKDQLLKLGVEERYILRGEYLLESIDATLKLHMNRIDGCLCITNFKLIFIPNGENEAPGKTDFYQILLMMIQSCERTVEKKGNQYSYIDIDCKDVRKFQFRFTFAQSEESFQFISLIIEHAFFKEIQRLPAFNFHKTNNFEEIYKGWQIFDFKQDFQRMGLQIADSSSKNSQCLYKYLENDQKQYCETYPPVLVVPAKLQDDDIRKCSKFRSRERLPALTFALKRENQHVTMWRCSQCKTGLVSRSSEDELMLKAIGDPQFIKDSKGNANLVDVHIYDARPFMNAVGNKFAGKGYESTSCYKNCEIQFLDIHNIHKVRDSYNKVVQMCLSPDHSKWNKDLDQSEWLDFISAILKGTDQICESMLKGIQVVVHCSDGWDRTSQLTALSQLCLDPYYRTIAGFQVLIEKDWVYFGHQFNLRLGHGSRNQNEETSPIFLQFLDCVHQLLQQYPLSFEFNEQLLVDIAFSSLNCMFGTFLRNFYQELIYQNKIRSETISVWSWINSRLQNYYNSHYKSNALQVIRPDSSPSCIQLWKRFFLYYQVHSMDQYKLYPNSRFMKDNVEQEHRKAIDELDRYQKFFSDLNINLPTKKEDLEAFTNKFKELMNQNNSKINTLEPSPKVEEKSEFEIIEKSEIKSNNLGQDLLAKYS